MKEKAKAIYDNWYEDIRILYSMHCVTATARCKLINRNAYVFLYGTHGPPEAHDCFVYQIYGRINMHIVKY